MAFSSPSLNTLMSLTDTVEEVCKVAIDQRDETEHLRRLAPAIVELIKSNQLCRLGLPKFLGGWEDDPVEVLKVFESLSSAEASVAWIIWNNHLACTFGRYLEKDRMEEIYGNPTDIYANSTRPEGYAKKVSGGYMVSGRWTLVSGCELADWFALRCIITKDDEPVKPGPGIPLKILFVPKDAVKIIDTWSVGGLRGTGSHDIKVKETFIPESHSVNFDHNVPVDTAYSRLPIGCMNSAGLAAMALGLAKSAVDELINMCFARITPGKNPDLRDRPNVQFTIAKSMATISSNRSYLFETVSSLWETSQKGNSFNDKQLANVWAASYQAATNSRSILSEIYSVAGTASLYSKNSIERSHRDIHAMLQHGIVQPHWMNQAGMAFVGLTPTASMFRT